MNQIKAKLSPYAWVVWLAAALFYSIEFFQRVAPGVIAEPLQKSLHVGPETLGLVISFYLYAYAIAQIPVGVFLDRFGNRLALTVASATVALGTILFASVESLWALALARILVGVGSAFAFVGCLRLANAWFSKSYFPVVVGLTNTIGVIGALFGEAPLNAMIHSMGWQHALMITGVIALGISALIFIFVRNRPKVSPDPRHPICCDNDQPILATLKEVLGHGRTWITAIYASIMVSPVIAFAELWAVPFLKNAHHFDNNQASFSTSLIFIGIAVGGPTHGLLGGLFKRRKPVMFFGQLGALICLSAIIFATHLSLLPTQTLLFLFGFCISSMLLCFPINAEYHNPKFSATVIAFTNMLIMLVGAIFQPLIGWILELIGASKPIADYSSSDFTHALMLLPIVLLINFILLAGIKDAKS